MTNKRFSVRLPEELANKVSSFARESGASQNEVITRSIHYFFENKGLPYATLVEIYEQSLDERLHPIQEELKRLRYANNQIATNSQMNNEFWNDYLLKHGDGNTITTDVKRANEYDLVQANVMNNILNQQQKKYS